MFVFILQFLQFLRETLLTIQNFDVCFRFDPVVSVVSAWRLQIFDMCVFFSVQCVVLVRENQRFLGVCSFLSCSFCSFYWDTPLRIQIFNICVHFDPVLSVVFAWKLQIFDICVFFSMQFVVYLRENQIIQGVCLFLPCSFCSF